MNLGERLKKLREMRNLTLEEVGNHIGVNKATVQRYESGNIDIKRHIAIKLAEIFKVSPTYIMGWTDNISVDGDKIFSINLRKARLKKYLSAQQVMDALGVFETTYSGYEDGWLEPDIATIRAISKLLDVSSDDLLGINNSDKALDLSEHEQRLINSYRQNTEMQTAVNTLLGINADEDFQKQKQKKNLPVSNDIDEDRSDMADFAEEDARHIKNSVQVTATFEE